MHSLLLFPNLCNLCTTHSLKSKEGGGETVALRARGFRTLQYIHQCGRIPGPEKRLSVNWYVGVQGCNSYSLDKICSRELNMKQLNGN